MYKKIFVALPVILISFLICTVDCFAIPAGFHITEIANATGPLNYQFYRWAAMNENGVVCYKGANLTTSAILKGDGTQRQVVAQSDDGTGEFERFFTGICSISNNGEVAFDACQNCTTTPSFGVYTRTDSGSPLRVIQKSGGGPNDFKLVSFPTINNTGSLGEVSFSGELNNGLRGIWIKSGATLQSAFDSTGIFSELGGAFLNDTKQLTFAAKENGTPPPTGIYGPSANRIIGTFNGFSDEVSFSVINNSGNIVALASQIPSAGNSNPENGVYINGAPFVVNRGEFVSVDISSFQAVSMNDAGDIVFPAFRANGNSAVFLAVQGGILPIIEKGDLIPGYTSPVNLAMVSREAINNSRQIALAVVLQDKTELVIRLDPVNVVFPDDQCPLDNYKFTPGVCGCGVADADANQDGILDCQVTQKVSQITQDLIQAMGQLKKLPSSASKAKKKAMSATIKKVKSLANQLLVLVRSSQAQVKLSSNKQSPLSLASGVRSQAIKASNTSDRNFSVNKKKALKASKKFLGLLVLS